MSGRLPQPFIDDLLARTDLLELVAARVTLKPRGQRHFGLCPFHAEKTPSFSVHPQRQIYYCFGCGASGNALSFLMAFDGLGFRDAVAALAEQCGVAMPDSVADPKADHKRALNNVLAEAAQLFRRALKAHPQAIEYLKQRGLTGLVAQRFGLGYAPDQWRFLLTRLGRTSDEVARLIEAGLVIEPKGDGRPYDRFRDRIVFPIRDTRGHVLGFGGRSLGSAEPKYLNSPETSVFSKGRVLYGLFEATEAGRSDHRDEPLLVVEGYMDVIALAQHGLPRVVATLGTATTAEHIKELVRRGQTIAFCFDGDAAGRRAAWQALTTCLPIVRDDREIKFLFMPDGEDPDSLIRREGAPAMRARLGQAEDLPAVFFRNLRLRHNLNTLSGRANLIEEARPLVLAIQAPILKQQMVAELERLTGVDAKTIRGQPAGRAAKGPRAPARRELEMTAPRLALALVLQWPALAREVESRRIPAPSRRWEVDLLRTLLERLRREPELNSARLLESLREHPQFDALAGLAARDLTGVPAAPSEPEPPASEATRDVYNTWMTALCDALDRVLQRQRESRIEALLARSEELSHAEMAELEALLRERSNGPDAAGSLGGDTADRNG